MQILREIRHNSRIITIQKLFELDFADSVNETTKGKKELFSETNLLEISNIHDFDKVFIQRLFKGVTDNKRKIDLLIEKLAPEWPLNNISKIDLQILRLAIAEGFILRITPPKIAIDEAIELSKEFSNDQTRKFISGVLGNLYTNQKTLLENGK